jgi:hypothetical protein
LSFGSEIPISNCRNLGEEGRVHNYKFVLKRLVRQQN